MKIGVVSSAAFCLALGWLACPARAQVFTPYPVPAGTGPYSITTGPDGALWFTGYDNAGWIGRITTGGAVTVYAIPTPFSSPNGITTGPDGALWFGETLVNKIGRITIDGQFTEYSIPNGYSPFSMAAGPDGNLWFSGYGIVGQVTPSGAFTEYPTATSFLAGQPHPPSSGVGITAGPDGALWFTGFGSIGRITTGGSMTSFQVPVSGCQYGGGITSGPDGALWFFMQCNSPTGTANYIGRITTAGAVTMYPTPSATPWSTEGGGITAGPDGALWFTEPNVLGPIKIGRVTTGGVFSEFTLPANTAPPSGQANGLTGITAGPDGAIWFGLEMLNQVGQLSGIGSPQPLSFTPSNLSFQSEGAGVTTVPQPITLMNNSTAPVPLTSIMPTGLNPGAFHATTCPATLAAGGSCIIYVEFTPPAAANYIASLTATYNGGATSLSAGLSGSGIVTGDATISLSPPVFLTFGDTGVDASSLPLPVIVTNTGTVPVFFAGTPVTIVGSSQFRIFANACTGTLAVGAQCEIQITFLPSAIGGSSATLEVFDNAANSPQNLTLNGAGASPSFSISANPVGFGNVEVGGTSAPKSITITNNGTVSLYLVSSAPGGANPGAFNPDHGCATPLGTGIAPGASCTIMVTFTPPATGAFSANFTVKDGAGVQSVLVGLSGTGVASASVVTPTLLSFGNVSINYTSPPQFVTVTNTGLGLLTFTNIQVTGNNASSYSATSCASLAPGAKCTITVTFKPGPGSAGPLPAILSITDNAPGLPQTVNLTGTGVSGPVDDSPGVLVTSSAFPPNHVLHTYNGTVTVKNTGPYALGGTLYIVLTQLPAGVTATNATGTVAAGPYYSLSYPLASGASQTFPVVFTDTTGAPITFTPKVYSGPVQ